MNLSSSVAVVTGAARGIGLALAEALVSAGSRVVLSDVDGTALAKAAASLDKDRTSAVVTDVSSSASVSALAGEAVRRFGRIDLWINNAGLARHHRIVEYADSEIDLMLAVNLKGTILGSQAALRVMMKQGNGHIVNVISTASLRGIPTETVYCATKWGVRGFTQGLREEAATHGVRVTAVLPGGVDTAFWDDAAPGRVQARSGFLTARQVADSTLKLVQLDDSVVPQELVLRSMSDRDFSS